MASSADTIYLQGLDFFGAVVAAVPADGWDRPSPCAGWRALDVLGHVGATTRFGIDLLTGGTPSWQPTDVPGEAVEGDPGRWWAGLAEEARRVTAAADLDRVVEAPGGARSVADGLSFPAVDLFVHGWDLARSAGRHVEIPREAVDFGHELLGRLPSAQLRSPRVFADAVAVDDGSSPSDAFIAWTGRDPRWSAR